MYLLANNHLQSSRSYHIVLALCLSACFLFTSCTEETATPSDTSSTELLGGDGTIFDATANAFSYPYRSIPESDKSRFFIGNSFFNQNWVTAPSSTTLRDGIGPLMNARSCSGCHFKDGRGFPPADGITMNSMLLRLSIPGSDEHGADLPEPTYGGQFQPIAIQGVAAEGSTRIDYTEIAGTFPDGEAYSLRKPLYIIENLNYGTMRQDVLVSPRVAPQMIGMGLLEAIDESDILANADEEDRNGDGISGRANYVWSYENATLMLGRFGWKANQPTISQQVAGAFQGDLGITSPVFTTHGFTTAQSYLDTLPNGGNPEIAEKEFQDVVFYSRVLAVPAQRNYSSLSVKGGRSLFTQAKCNSCHIESMKTGNSSPIAALHNQRIYPYTDLLLHDMGDALADGRPDYKANGNEWRTPPLWGIGLFHTVNGHTMYLHDGRARSLQEAILWHGGEAEQAKQKYMSMSKEQRAELLEFLKSL